jgi:hypothetical protein
MERSYLKPNQAPPRDWLMASARNRLLIRYFLRIALLAGAPVSVGLCGSLPEKVSVDKPGPQEAALNADFRGVQITLVFN